MAKIDKEIGYPTTSVIFLYAFCGGAVGGFFIGLALWFINFYDEGLSVLLGVIFLPMIAMLFGVFFGLIPALVTGLILAIMEFMIKDKKDYLKVAFVGFLTSAIYMSIPLFNAITELENFLFILAIGLLGAISAVIVGKYALPKEDKVIKEI